MNNNLKTAWTNLVYIRNTKDKIEPNMSRVEFDILCLASLAPTTRAKIMRHEYFADTSLSTVKRAVTMLISYGLITITASDDNREKLITAVEL